MYIPFLQDFKKPFTISIPAKIIFGIGSIDKIIDELIFLKIKKPLVVTDQGIIYSGIWEIIERILKKNNIEYEIFSQLKLNPTYPIIKKGTHKYINNFCDGIIALGGGSTIDTAKVIGIQVNEGKPINEYVRFNNKLERDIPSLIAIPTTIATGSEINYKTILIDSKSKYKHNYFSPKIAPKTVVYDPQLLATLPVKLAAASGIASLTKAIECYVAKDATFVTDLFNIEAIRLVGSSLRQFVADPSNLDYAVKIQLASILTAICSLNLENGIVSFMANPLEDCLDIHYGVACGIMLPHVMQWNLIANPDKYALIAEFLGEEINGFSVVDRSVKAVCAIQKLVLDIGMPTSLTEIGFKFEMIEDIVQNLVENFGSNGNPRITTKEDIINLYNFAM
ncbi:MAG: iron-containing alcohol dehydrogenase [Peptococcales bacterium]